MKTLRRKSACIILRHRDGEGTQDVQENKVQPNPTSVQMAMNGFKQQAIENVPTGFRGIH